MSRQSISFTTTNAQWLKQKVEIEGEYSSNSEATNDAIRRMREAEKETELAYIRAKLIKAEKSVEERGWIEQSREGMLAEFKRDLGTDGKI